MYNIFRCETLLDMSLLDGKDVTLVDVSLLVVGHRCVTLLHVSLLGVGALHC